jgi:hypothetical protein
MVQKLGALCNWFVVFHFFIISQKGKNGKKCSLNIELRAERQLGHY